LRGARGGRGGREKESRKTESKKPPGAGRKIAGKKNSPPGPSPPSPRPAAPAAKAAPPAKPSVQSKPAPVPHSRPVPPPSPATPVIAEPGPSKKEQEKQARRELLETLRERWPQAFPRDYRQVRPLAIGIRQDIAAHLPEQPLGRIGAVIGLFQLLTGPAYYRAVLKGGPRYDVDGNPRGEVTPEDQERARQDLKAWYERRKQRQKRPPEEKAEPAP